MEPPFPTSAFLIFGLLVSLSSIRVDSQNGSPNRPPPPPQLAPPPPPPPSPPPSQSPLSPPSPPQSSPPPPSLPRNSRGQLKSRTELNRSPPPHRHHRRRHKKPPPLPPPPHHHHGGGINAGKKVGLLFSGIAGILQICVVSFLVFKRRQLLKVNNNNIYESYS